MIYQSNVDFMWNTVVNPRLGKAPYVFGGSFGPTDVTMGTDCSGAVSAELGALVNGPAMVWPRQFWTGTFAGAPVGGKGPYGGVSETSDLVCIAAPTNVPADAAMLIAVYQNSDPAQAHMICRVNGIDIEMGGIDSSYHTSRTNPNCSSVMDTSAFNQWFYLPGPIKQGSPPVTLYGIDISNNNFGGPTTPNLSAIAPFINQLVGEGFSWVEMKASQGGDFIDPCWQTVYQACVANSLPVVAYHYVDTSPPAGQAQNFLKALNGVKVSAMLDWEGGDWNNYVAVLNAFRAAGINVALQYIPKWYWSQNGAGDLTGTTGLVASDWVSGSGYASNLYPGDAAPNWAGYGGGVPAILQFTNSANVAGLTVDADAFVGTVTELHALLGYAPTPTPSGGWVLTQAQQEDLYNWAMWTFAFLFGELNNNPVSPLPGSPTPTSKTWFLGAEPSVAQALSTVQTALSTVDTAEGQILKAVNALSAAVASLSADFTTTSKGLAVLQKLAELNALLTTGQ
jgi:hypothetical protein